MTQIKKLGYDIMVDVENITPETAHLYLSSQSKNRRKSHLMIGRLQREIESGNYELNGQPIRFDEHNRLLDGQHRLYACVAANKPIVSLVIRGIRNETMKTIDMGRARSASDIFVIEEGKNKYSSTKTTVSKLLLFYRKNYEDLKTGDFSIRAWDSSFSPREIHDFYLENKEAVDYAIQMTPREANFTVAFGAGALAFCRIVLGELDRSLTSDFFESLLSGVIPPKWKAIAQIREYFFNRKKREIMRDWERASIIFGLWNILQLEDSHTMTFEQISDRISEARFNIPALARKPSAAKK